ncbi:MAG: metallophosphoesterase, partial [Bacteroidota bacterium]
MSRQIFLLIVVSILFLLDLYVFQLIKTLTASLTGTARTLIHVFYWVFNLSGWLAILSFVIFPRESIHHTTQQLLSTWIGMVYIPKLFGLIFLLLDDFIRLLTWIYEQIMPAKLSEGNPEKNTIPRSEFLMKAGLVAMTIPVVTTSWGIISGAHDYRVRRRTLYLPNLPKAFDGIRLVQISDVHSGSFYNKTAVSGGIDKILGEKPDAIFFTGDLVNNKAVEMKDYQDIFSRLKAPLGVYSVLGNHDYGDYVTWESAQAKQRNLQDLIATHRHMGWDILMNEHRFLEVDNEKIAVIGIENWGAKGRFAKYGDLEKAHQGTEDAPVKILLSHDPSHWDAQINGSKAEDYMEYYKASNIQKYAFKDIDLTLSGHTHGMQFGVDSEVFRWSPVKYMYEQWADLHQHENQYLYV